MGKGFAKIQSSYKMHYYNRKIIIIFYNNLVTIATVSGKIEKSNNFA